MIQKKTPERKRFFSNEAFPKSYLILIVLLRVVEKFVIGLDICLPTPRSLPRLLVRVEVDVQVLAILDRCPLLRQAGLRCPRHPLGPQAGQWSGPFQMPRVIMWGLSLYCCVSHRCCKAEQRLTHFQPLSWVDKAPAYNLPPLPSDPPLSPQQLSSDRPPLPQQLQRQLQQRLPDGRSARDLRRRSSFASLQFLTHLAECSHHTEMTTLVSNKGLFINDVST